MLAHFPSRDSYYRPFMSMTMFNLEYFVKIAESEKYVESMSNVY